MTIISDRLFKLIPNIISSKIRLLTSSIGPLISNIMNYNVSFQKYTVILFLIKVNLIIHIV